MIRCALLLAALAAVALALPEGPPPAACTTISPDPLQHGAQPQAGNGGYSVYTNLVLDRDMEMYNYTAGETYNVRVISDGDVQLRGFMVQARDPSDTPIGMFNPTGNMQQVVSCPNGNGPTIGHRNLNSDDFLPEMFTWTAPDGDDGYVNFRFAVVRTRMVYFANQDAAAIASTAPTMAPATVTTVSSAPATAYASMILALFCVVSVWYTL